MFLGHPNVRKLDEDINKLLDNGKLEGAGTKASAAEEASQWNSAVLVPACDVEPNIEKFID